MQTKLIEWDKDGGRSNFGFGKYSTRKLLEDFEGYMVTRIIMHLKKKGIHQRNKEFMYEKNDGIG